jgi:hypothetical protein
VELNRNNWRSAIAIIRIATVSIGWEHCSAGACCAERF